LKIRTQFIFTALLFALILVIVAVSAVYTNIRVEQVNDSEMTVANLVQQVNELSYLSNDYILHPGDLQLSRWQAKYSSILTQAESINPAVQEQIHVVSHLKTDLSLLKTVFNEITAVSTQTSSVSTSLAAASWSRLEVQNQSIISDAVQLDRLLRSQVDGLRNAKSLLMYFLIGIFGFFLLVMYVLNYRRVARGLEVLKSGTDIIGSGNLDYAIPEKSRDEIGDLSRAFNRMAANLQHITASKSELEKTIAECRVMETNLSRSNAKIQEILNSIQEDFYVLDRNWNFVYVSKVYVSRIGKKPEDFLGHSFWQLFPNYIGTDFENNLRTAMDQREILRFEFKGPYTGRWYSMSIFPSPEGITVMGTDISQQKQAESALVESEERLRLAVDAADFGVWDLDPVSRKSVRSLRHDQIFGYQELQSKWTLAILLNHILPEDRDKVREALTPAQGKYSLYLEARIKRVDGSLGWIMLTGRFYFDVQGNLVRINGVCADISERKQIEESLNKYTRELENHRAHLEDLVAQRTQELQTLSYRLLMVQEEERRTISRELHDQTGQSLTVINLLLAKALRSPESSKEDLQAVQQMAREILGQVRTLSSSLHPGMIEDLGLIPTLNWYLTDFSHKTGINVSIIHTGFEGKKLSGDTNITIYRIIQEALTNIARYAGVKDAFVTLDLTERAVSIKVQDFGCGFVVSSQPQGVGLRGMRERVNALDGKLSIHSAPGDGTTIEAEIPITESKNP
jgi:PAS domain S-box-containing protein